MTIHAGNSSAQTPHADTNQRVRESKRESGHANTKSNRVVRWFLANPIVGGLVTVGVLSLLVGLPAVIGIIASVTEYESGTTNTSLIDPHSPNAAPKDRTIVQGDSAAQTQAEIETLKSNAQHLEAKLEHHRYVSNVVAARQALAGGDLATALRFLDECRQSDKGADVRGFEWFYLWKQCLDESPPFILGGHTDDVTGITFSADHKTLASSSLDGTIRLWDAGNGQPTATSEKHALNFRDIAFSPTGPHLAAAGGAVAEAEEFAGTSGASLLFLWDLSAVAPATNLAWALGPTSNSTLNDVPIAPYCVTFSPNGDRLVFAGGRYGVGPGPTFVAGELAMWDVKNRKIERTFGELTELDRDTREPVRIGAGLRRTSDSNVRSAAFSPDGRTLAAGYENGRITLWDVESAAKRITWETNSSHVRHIAYSMDGATIASVNGDSTIVLWNAETGVKRLELRGHQGSTNRVAFSPDGQTLASSGGSGESGELKLWNLVTGIEVANHADQTLAVNAVAFSRNGRSMAAACGDNTVRIWHGATDEEASLPVDEVLARRNKVSGASRETLAKQLQQTPPKKINAHNERVAIVSWSPKQEWLATCTANAVKIWDGKDGSEIVAIAKPKELFSSLAWNADGTRLAVRDRLRTIAIFDTTTGEAIEELPCRSSSLTESTICWSPAANVLAAAESDGVHLWNLVNTKQLPALSINLPRGLAWSPDNKKLAVDTPNGITVWDVSRETTLFTLNASFPCRWSPDGKQLATKTAYDAAVKETVVFWDGETGARIGELEYPGAIWAQHIAWSPDGKWLATISNRSSGDGGEQNNAGVWIWDTNTKREFTWTRGQPRSGTSISWSASGAQIATGSDDGSVYFWDTSPLGIKPVPPAAPAVDIVAMNIGGSTNQPKPGTNPKTPKSSTAGMSYTVKQVKTINSFPNPIDQVTIVIHNTPVGQYEFTLDAAVGAVGGAGVHAVQGTNHRIVIGWHGKRGRIDLDDIDLSWNNTAVPKQ